MSKMNGKFLMMVATVATVLASMVATSACFYATYQPEEPECLRD